MVYNISMKHLLSFAIILLLSSYINLLAKEDLITDAIVNKAYAKYGKFAKNRFIQLNQKIIKKLKQSKAIKKLTFVNSWFNKIQYRSDKKIYGVSDYWATLYEFTGKGMGDCEDYTIAKYYTLKELGINPRRMKFTYVVYINKSGKKISHMVLSYLKVPKPKSMNDILILDNTNKQVLPASKRKNIIKMVKMINGDTGPKSKKWKKMEKNMKRKKL